MVGIIHVGLGAIGKATVLAILERPGETLGAVVDTDPKLAGANLAAVLGKQAPAGAEKVQIVPTLKQARALAPDAKVAIVTTESRMEMIRGTLEQCAEQGFNVVSSCEELAWPMLRNLELADYLDRVFKSRKLTLLGTGVNPGFAMDTFALMISAGCGQVKAIRCTRSLDAKARRQQLQDKVAAGLSLEEFRRALAAKKIGLVGCAESAALLAAGMGWKLDEVDEWYEPVVAEEPVISGRLKIPAGRVRGMRLMAVASSSGRKVVEMDLTMAVGAETYDEISIDGEPNLNVRVTTGFPGDNCTVSLLVNCSQTLLKLKPGLRTMLDLVPLRGVGV